MLDDEVSVLGVARRDDLGGGESFVLRDAPVVGDDGSTRVVGLSRVAGSGGWCLFGFRLCSGQNCGGR